MAHHGIVPPMIVMSPRVCKLQPIDVNKYAWMTQAI